MNSRNKILIALIIALALIPMAGCNNSKKNTENNKEKAKSPSEIESDTIAVIQRNTSGNEFLVLEHYLTMKDALVSDDQQAASNAGVKLSETFQNWELDSIYQEKEAQLMSLVVKIEEHGLQISLSEIEEQREVFASLSEDMLDLIAITGTPKTLYQQYCPMYKNNTGGIWLSDSKEIRNPLFGSQMLKCGAIQAELK